MKKRFINSLVLTALFTTIISFKAHAAVDAYLLKHNTNVYQYNIEELKDSFMNSKLGVEDGLYKEFRDILSIGEFYLIHDSEGKYVSYDEIKNTFLDKKVKEEEFDLNDEVKLGKVSEMPAQIEDVKKENNRLKRELFILKDSTILDGSKINKDKYAKIHIKANNVTVSNLETLGEIVVDPGKLGKARIDNVKCANINILSGDKIGIVFNKVESKEVKIDTKLGIEIQYENKTGSNNGGGTGTTIPAISDAERQRMLNKAYTQLNQVHSIITNTKEKQVVAKMMEGINTAINDKDYNYSNDILQAKNLYNTLNESEKNDLQSKLLNYVDLINVYQLMEAYGITL